MILSNAKHSKTRSSMSNSLMRRVNGLSHKRARTKKIIYTFRKARNTRTTRPAPTEASIGYIVSQYDTLIADLDRIRTYLEEINDGPGSWEGTANGIQHTGASHAYGGEFSGDEASGREDVLSLYLNFPDDHGSPESGVGMDTGIPETHAEQFMHAGAECQSMGVDTTQNMSVEYYQGCTASEYSTPPSIDNEFLALYLGAPADHDTLLGSLGRHNADETVEAMVYIPESRLEEFERAVIDHGIEHKCRSAKTVHNLRFHYNLKSEEEEQGWQGYVDPLMLRLQSE